MIDLLIIGAGLSGLTAALIAAKSGLKVRIIAKGMGAIHWQAGTIDVLGYIPGSDQPVRKPFAEFDSLPTQHPYRQLGEGSVCCAVTDFVQTVTQTGLTYRNSQTDHANLLLPSPVGAVRPTLFAPQAQVNGNLSDGSPLLIVGFAGMRDFYPHLIAENLCKQGYEARAELLPLATISLRQDNNPVHLAQSLDLPARRHHLGAALKKLVRVGERVGLPAILGLEQHSLTFAELQTQTGALLFEIPTLPPSVPGIRLYRRLAGELEKLGVRIEPNMEVVGFQSEGKKIAWVETATSARPVRHWAGKFLLATGGVLGGGFNSDHTGKVWDVVFNLPLTTLQDRRQWFQSRFLDERGHPIFSGGVAVNQDWQPIDAHGAVVYENVWAAGGTLAHADGIRERSLEGIAISTGTAAVLSMQMDNQP